MRKRLLPASYSRHPVAINLIPQTILAIKRPFV